MHRGPFDTTALYTSERGLTGSENSFWNAVRALDARGHEVVVTANTTQQIPSILGGATVLPIELDNDTLPNFPKDCDAYLTWNEPDLLRFVPKEKTRIACHQIGSFGHCYGGYDKYVDQFVLLSETHRKYVMETTSIDPLKLRIIPNSIDLSFYENAKDISKRGAIAFISSADRGLHRMIEIFKEVRKRVPHATLHVFYEWKKLYEKQSTYQTFNGLRLRYINTLLEEMGTEGQCGLYLHGSVSTRDMIDFLCQEVRVFAYPCEPVAFTETFSVATLDACAAGCVPIISDADALGEIYGGSTVVIPGKPMGQIDTWVNYIENALVNNEMARKLSETALSFSRKFDVKEVGKNWEEFIKISIANRMEEQS